MERAKKGLEKPPAVEALEAQAVSLPEEPVRLEAEAVEAAEVLRVESSDQTKDAADKYEQFIEEETDSDEEPSLEEDMSGEDDAPVGRGKILEIVFARKKQLLVFALVVLAAFAVSTALGGRAEGEKNGISAILTKDGAGTMKDSFAAMKDVKSYSYDGTMKFYYKYKDEQSKAYNTNFQIKSSGIADKSDEHPGFYSSVAYNAYSNINSADSEADLAAESLSKDGVEYLKPVNFSVQGAKSAETAELERELKSDAGKWYTVSTEERGKFYETTMRYFSMPTQLLNMEDLGKGSGDDLSGILSDGKLFSFKKDLGSEKINNSDTAHYQVTLETTEAFTLAADMLSQAAAQGDDSAAGILDELRRNTKESGALKQAVDFALEQVDLELWIGKKDKFIYRFRLSGSFNRDFLRSMEEKLNELYGSAYAADTKNIPDVEFGFDFDYTLDGFNSSHVTKPDTADTFAEVLKRLQSGGTGAGTGVDTDGDGLSSEQEKFYGTDASKADTDGDGFSDGDEVKNGFDPTIPGSVRLDYDKLNKANG